MIKAEMFEPNDYCHETPAARLCNFINNKKIKNYTLVEEDIDIIFKGDLCEVYRNEVDIISKDLERLEKLEKVIEMLKKAFLLSVGELRGIYFTLAYDNNYVMTKEEYDLLKEVLEDE